MIHNNILLYSQMVAQSSQHQRSFLQQQTGVCAELLSRYYGGRQSLHWRSPSIPLTQGLGNMTEDVEERWQESEEKEDSRRTWSPDSTKQDSDGLTDTEAASMEPAWCVPGPLLVPQDCYLGVFVVLLTMEESLTLLLALGTVSCCWFVLTSLNMRVFLSYCVFFVLLWFGFWNPAPL